VDEVTNIYIIREEKYNETNELFISRFPVKAYSLTERADKDF